MAYSYSDPLGGSVQPTVQIKRVGGWKFMVGAMLAAAGLGFAGYLYAVPYQKLSKALGTQASALKEEQSTRAEEAAEREKLKADLGKHESVEQDKAEALAKKKEAAEVLSTELRTALGAIGANVVLGDDARVNVTFPTSAIFDQPTATGVSGQGETALKILASAAKKADAKVTVRARLIPAPPPRELAQFKNIGEFAMLRAVRVALTISNAGVKPEFIAAAGAPPEVRKGKPGVPDRVEVEIEKE